MPLSSLLDSLLLNLLVKNVSYRNHELVLKSQLVLQLKLRLQFLLKALDPNMRRLSSVSICVKVLKTYSLTPIPNDQHERFY